MIAKQKIRLENNKEGKGFMLSPLNNFIIGMGSILDIYGNNPIWLFDGRTDAEKIKDDWFKIGNDIRKSYFSKLETLKK